MSTHLAASYPSASSGIITIEPRPTPTPTPNELLIHVSSIALNPVDAYQRDKGLPPMPFYPYIGGMDISGTVLSPSSHPLFPPGTRVAAFGTSFFSNGRLDYGGFQEKVLVPVTNVVPLPDTISFNQGALVPSGTGTVFAGFHAIGLPLPHSGVEGHGILIWGGSSCVGSAAIQIAKSMGYVTYVTASPKHHAYLSTLGANYLFDYHSPTIVNDVASAAREHGISINIGYHAAGRETADITSSIQILAALKSPDVSTAKLAVAPLIPEDVEQVEGVEAKFALPPMEPTSQSKFFGYIFNTWLKSKLSTGEFVPCPQIKLIEGKGLEGISKGLDILNEGVSGVKLVVELL